MTHTGRLLRIGRCRATVSAVCALERAVAAENGRSGPSIRKSKQTNMPTNKPTNQQTNKQTNSPTGGWASGLPGRALRPLVLARMRERAWRRSEGVPHRHCATPKPTARRVRGSPVIPSTAPAHRPSSLRPAVSATTTATPARLLAAADSFCAACAAQRSVARQAPKSPNRKAERGGGSGAQDTEGASAPRRASHATAARIISVAL